MDVRVVGLHHSHRGIPVVACAPSQQQFRLGGVVSRFLLALFLASVASNVSLSKAASQGSVGKTSSGSFTITLVIPPRLTVQTFAVAPDSSEPETAQASPTDASTAGNNTNTAVTVQTAKQVLSNNQALQAAQSRAQASDTTPAPSSNTTETEALPEAPAEIIPTNTLQQKLCIQGNGMSHYSLQASGSRNDSRMVLSSDGGNEVPYQVVLNDRSSTSPINLQTPKTLPLSNQKDCSTSPVVSIDLSNTARNNLQDSRYYGAAQVTVAAE
ncbi:hypothetical protein [Kistimonas asteriae]|uniref:hypothetical protein n=1 Tax=Kistimonas asteriae TaxID=517724 RepID=UPI001BA7502A|nr:hypothetical protein [Kistimonas asteriae]